MSSWSPRRARTRLAAAIWAGAVAAAPAWAQTVVHREKSAFEDIVVYDAGGQRCMKFGGVDAPGRQSCIAPLHPRQLQFDYTRMMMASLYLQPRPARVLVIGLGGGSLPMALAEAVPSAVVDAVDIDPAVVRVAREYFGFRTGPRLRAHVGDGRAFVQAAARAGDRYDIVMLDAFDENYIPRHLLTVEFLREVRSILAPGGVLAANTFTSSHLYADESATYAAVFGAFYNLRSANRVILATVGALPPRPLVERRAQVLRPGLAALGIDDRELLPMFSATRDWPADAQPLHDQ